MHPDPSNRVPLPMDALEHLADTDRWLTHRGGWSSLSPECDRASSLVDLARRGLRAGDGLPFRAAFCAGLGRLARVQAEHFPGNLFCDLDLLCDSLLEASRRDSRDPVAALEHAFLVLEELNALYGRHSVIRFRYLHDFLYGWDWARWVSRDPDSRRSIGPFAPCFLEALLERARELAQLISRRDRHYHRLDPGQFRNPFVFQRDPQAERQLHSTLAARGLVPLKAWQSGSAPDWNKPWTPIRLEVARELGLERSLPVGPSADPS